MSLDELLMRAQVCVTHPPGDIGPGDPFQMWFVRIESVLPLDRTGLLVMNDNNFPFSTGRNPTLPDDSEFIIIRSAR